MSNSKPAPSRWNGAGAAKRGDPIDDHATYITVMRIKPLVGGMERKTLDVLDRVLRGTAFRVCPKMRLADVLEPESGDVLLPGEQRFRLMSHFDFVVADRRTHQPVFAVEFDGPLHEVPPQPRRDIRKNRLCKAGNFPLLRIGDAALEAYEQRTVLEFMLQRFVAWQQEHSAIEEIGRAHV